MTIKEFGRILEDESQEVKTPSFGRSLEPKKEEKKSLLEKGVDKAIDLQRLPSQLSARGLEHIVAAPRELGDFLEGLVPKKTLIKGAEKIGLGEGAKKFIEFTENHAPHKLFPNREDARHFTKKLFGDLYEPKNKWEERAGDAFGEFAALTMPFLGGVKPIRAILTSAGANMSKAIADDLKLESKWGNNLKAGTYLLGALIHPKAGEKFYEKNYDLANQVLPQNATYSSVPLQSTLNSLKINLKKGGVSSADSPALKQIKNIEKEIQGAQVPIDSLMASKRKLNIERGNLYEQLKSNKAGIKTAKRNMDLVADALDETLNAYGRQDPNFGKYFEAANNSFAAVAGSKKFGQMMHNNFSKFAISHLGLSALLGHLGGLKLTGGVSAAAYPTYKIGQTFAQIMKSPHLKKEFFRLYREGLKGNVKGMDASIQNLQYGLNESNQ